MDSPADQQFPPVDRDKDFEVTAALETAMDAAWPALERHATGGWVFRAAAGVTQRANSIWPRPLEAGQPGADLPGLLREARSWYRSRRLPVIFQVFDNPASEPLHRLLDAEGFTRQSETLVMARPAAQMPLTAAAPAASAVEISAEPSPEWLRVWWQVDGRGGDALNVAQQILAGCPSVYALVRDSDGRAAAVGRLALPADSGCGGLYAMATLPEARRCGYATAILEGLLQAGQDRGVTEFWLLVTAANHGAQELYARAGFRAAGRYLYRQERPRRPPSAC